MLTIHIHRRVLHVFRIKPSKKYRMLVSCLLAVSLLGFSSGLSEISAVSVRAAAMSGARFRYDGLSREEFPLLVGTWLKQGKYAPFTRAAQPAFPIPALGEGYVPQGMCYSEALDCFVLAYYYPDGARPSLLALVDADSGQCVKQLYLLGPGGMPYTGHAGGAAAWGEHVWVTSESRAYRLAADDIRRAADRGTLRFRDSFSPGTRGDFAFCAEGMLWVGDYHKQGASPAYFDPQEDPGSGNRAWCAGFRLSKSAAQGVVGLRRGADAPAPAAVLSVVDRVQGACAASTGELLLSSSFTTRQPSTLWVFPPLRELIAQPPARHVSIAKASVPLWIVGEDMAINKQMLAPMSEGISALDGEIYVLYESAALLYRERAALYADYVFSIPEGIVIPGEAEVPPEEEDLHEQISVEM